MTQETPVLRLLTPRLELVAATADMLTAELDEPAELANLLSATVPQAWPPAPMGTPSLRAFIRGLLSLNDVQAGWRFWYFVLTESSKRILIGNGGFKGPPNHNGMIEAGYSVLEAYQNRGYCSEAMACLFDWAFSQPRVRRLEAETSTDNRASIRVMEKNGLSYMGPGLEADTVRYGRGRAD